MFYFSLYFSAVLAKGEMEPERKETRTKVDEDRKHEYPYRPRPYAASGQGYFFRVFRHVINPDVTRDSLCNFFFHNQGHLTLTIVASISWPLRYLASSRSVAHKASTLPFLLSWKVCLVSIMIFFLRGWDINPSPNHQPGGSWVAIHLAFHPKPAQHC